MRKFVSLLVILGMAAITPSVSEAATINLSPGDPGLVEYDVFPPNNCEPDCIEDEFGIADGLLTLYYKSDYGNSPNGTDSGSFADSYNTLFSGDPNDATISWINGQPSIECPNCYLAIKDGNADPSYYFYNLADWDGISDIIMTGFWPGNDKGAISHVSIWGYPGEEEGEGEEDGSTIPEPASMLLIGAGLAAVAARMRQRKG
jgi:hypothetical protein